MAELYRTKVQQLADALEREDARTEASEMLRGLIDSIVLMPEKGQLRIELRGNLAAMLTIAQKKGSEQESVPSQCSCGFLQTDEFGLRGGLTLRLEQQVAQIGVPASASE